MTRAPKERHSEPTFVVALVALAVGCSSPLDLGGTCAKNSDCVASAFCSGHVCTPKSAGGKTCTDVAQCASGICGVSGSGHCCAVACVQDSAHSCNATDCDELGACSYPCSSKADGGVADGGVPDGADGACTSDQACTSGICGIAGTGHCCTKGCNTSDATCGAKDCDSTGACVYPNSAACGRSSCAGNQLTTGACDATGACNVGTAACPGGLLCAADGGSCLTSCAATTDCVAGFYCSGTHCAPQIASGACTTNEACTSGICGLSGIGACCTVRCNSSADPACNPTSCDVGTGACVYPNGAACGTSSCTGSQLTAGACDATGACTVGTAPCPGGLVCATGGSSCITKCVAIADCAAGFYCSGTHCVRQIASGACTTNEACGSGICGIAGTGHCCWKACKTSDAICGANDCDDTGACSYPANTTSCDPSSSCTGGTTIDPGTCDGAGTCPPSCASGDFCDTAKGACCSALTSGDTIAVDGANGSDATACCGIGSNSACLTLTRALALINAGGAQNVTINATVSGGGGDWTGKETYPVTLASGVELNAPGIFFFDPAIVANPEIFDVTGSASIVGTAKSPISAGFNSAGEQSRDTSTIVVEPGGTLYIANASINGSNVNGNNAAILVSAAATLMLGQDQSAAVTGTVTIGNALGNVFTDGMYGIWCLSDLKTGCTVLDAPLVGQSSVVIQGQEAFAIWATDYSVISLTSAPIIGVPPSSPGFNNCAAKVDALYGNAAIMIEGNASVTFKNGTVQCLGGIGTGFQLVDSFRGIGAPTLTVDNTIIQNTELGVVATLGTASFTNSTFRYNYNGVVQGQGGTQGTSGTIDLSGGGNTVICSNSKESTQGGSNPGIDVYNQTPNNLAADNVAWDTSGPDYFSCDPDFTSCTCNIASCTNSPNGDDMDAVEDSTNLGGITTTGATQSANACN